MGYTYQVDVLKTQEFPVIGGKGKYVELMWTQSDTMYLWMFQLRIFWMYRSLNFTRLLHYDLVGITTLVETDDVL